jgi:hypothetical protein
VDVLKAVMTSHLQRKLTCTYLPWLPASRCSSLGHVECTAELTWDLCSNILAYNCYSLLLVVSPQTVTG